MLSCETQRLGHPECTQCLARVASLDRIDSNIYPGIGRTHLIMTSALASLTATYTDSEGEEEGNEQIHDEGLVTLKSPSGSNSDNKSNASSRPSSPAPMRLPTKVAKLVSYHDDTVASDEEGDLEDEVPHQVVIIPDEKKNEEQLIDDVDNIIPPEPPGHCSIELQEKITKLYEKMQNQQLDMNAVIQKRKDFRNPSIYEKLIQFCGLNELDSNTYKGVMR
ncbi:hypothetical protein NQ315_014559 [Exocentrus adspersus]|uniref:Uncharacterized protein n=1 Tax=Exocentrus adspersus TaxID=1586481 RepID=A0AAV8VKQ2_9CUCU|nr:hypothetical protein NQ315_014559 [Exocentrus adspersus]